ncbi:MAG: protein kinase [Thiobacillaceae bacterium]
MGKSLSAVLSEPVLPQMNKIGRFEILEELGRGSMGVVYRALDPLIERTVAIKTIPLDLPENERVPFEDRFLREAKSAGRLSHPHIVTIYDVGETGNMAYIAMEYLKGQSLKDILDQHGCLPLDLALVTAIQMAEALAFANEHGIVHRDVKPGNVIVLEERGNIKLTDFGIAHIGAQGETHQNVLMGSPRYMAPEQITGNPIDGRTDVFSAGVVLYEMLTGQAPFTAPDLHMLLYRIVNEIPAPVSRFRPDVPPELDSLLARCMAKQPEQRPASARELYFELEKIAAQISVEQPPLADEKRPKQLAIAAFSIPVLVFLILSIGLIVIEHFVPQSDLAPTIYEPNAKHNSASTGNNRPTETKGGKRSDLSTRHSMPAGTQDYFLTNIDKKLAELRVKRAEMLSTYTEIHPDVVLLDRKIEELEQERTLHLKTKQGKD